MVTFIKADADSLGIAMEGIPKEFVFPYKTEDPKEIAELLKNGATIQAEAPPKRVPQKEVSDDGDS